MNTSSSRALYVLLQTLNMVVNQTQLCTGHNTKGSPRRRPRPRHNPLILRARYGLLDSRFLGTSTPRAASRHWPGRGRTPGPPGPKAPPPPSALPPSCRRGTPFYNTVSNVTVRRQYNFTLKPTQLPHDTHTTPTQHRQNIYTTTCPQTTG